MGDLMNYRRKLLFLILFFLVLFAFADTGSAWIGWATIISMLVVLIIIDFMFLDDTYFTFDPDYKNYARKTTPVY